MGVQYGESGLAGQRPLGQRVLNKAVCKPQRSEMTGLHNQMHNNVGMSLRRSVSMSARLKGLTAISRRRFLQMGSFAAAAAAGTGIRSNWAWGAEPSLGTRSEEHTSELPS